MHFFQVKFKSIAGLSSKEFAVTNSLNEVKKSGYKIIALLCGYMESVKILEEASMLNMTSSKWVWILPSDVMNYVAVSNIVL